MKLIITSLSLVLLVSTLNSCNKTKTNANRIEDGEWEVTELSVDGVNQDELPHLHFSDCDTYSSPCTGEWENHEGVKVISLGNLMTKEKPLPSLTNQKSPVNMRQMKPFCNVKILAGIILLS